jgi:hypothetical protein
LQKQSEISAQNGSRQKVWARFRLLPKPKTASVVRSGARANIDHQRVHHKPQSGFVVPCWTLPFVSLKDLIPSVGNIQNDPSQYSRRRGGHSNSSIPLQDWFQESKQCQSVSASHLKEAKLCLISADQKYREFGEDIRSLAINLSLLSQVVRRAEQQAGSLKRASRSTKPGSGANAASVQVLGNFKETLNDCQSLLSDETYFQKSDEFVSNVSWYHQIDPEIQKLREKIAFHNIKVTTPQKYAGA